MKPMWTKGTRAYAIEESWDKDDEWIVAVGTVVGFGFGKVTISVDMYFGHCCTEVEDALELMTYEI